MTLSNRSRPSAVIAIGALVGALVALPGVAAAQGDSRSGSIAGSDGAYDLAAALDADGAFHGIAGLSGTVDIADWTLVSDVAAGQAPRFARAKRKPHVAPADTWAAVGPNGSTPSMNAEVAALTPTSSRLYVGGLFYNAGGTPNPNNADSLAKWSGSAWSAVGSTNDVFGPNTVAAIAVDGDDLYLGGTFSNAAAIGAADHIVMWDDSSSAWTALGSGLNGNVRALAFSSDDLFVGGDFTDAGGINPADYIARWDGSWHKVGDHNGGRVLSNHVYALAVNSGDVYAGGLFTNADGDRTADYIAKWNGSSWSNLGSNPAGTNGALGAEVWALRFSGRTLYVGGTFRNAAGIAQADRVARWRGGSWAALGSNPAGTNGALGNDVLAIAVAGEDVYVGGRFFNAAGIAEADRVAKWDGSDWSALGSDGSGDGALDNTVQALGVFGGELYVGGLFHDAAGIPEADYLAAWGIAAFRLPDGRVRVGTSGSWTGNDIYNTSGDHQKVEKSAARGRTITFQVSIQNDSLTAADQFTVDASGAASSNYTVRYLKGSSDITTDVANGNYQTTSLAPGATYLIKVQIEVGPNAPANSKVTRKLTLTSMDDPTRHDAVKVVGKRS